MKKIIAAVAVAIALTVGGLYFAGIIHIGGSKPKADVAAEHKVEAPPVYLALDPPFVVNFTHRGTLRYLQVSIELMYHDPALLTKVKEHMPAIRNDLILLFTQAFRSQCRNKPQDQPIKDFTHFEINTRRYCK